METIVITVHVIVAIAIVVLVLLQQGKGADAGAAFGSGASNTIFGSSGSGNFLTRATTISAVIFFATSLVLAIYAKQYVSGGMIDGLPIVDDSLPSTDTVNDSDVPQVSAPAQPSDDIPAVPQGNQ